MNSNKTYKFVIKGTSVPCRRADCEYSDERIWKNDPLRPYLNLYSEKQVLETLKMYEQMQREGKFSIKLLSEQLEEKLGKRVYRDKAHPSTIGAFDFRSLQIFMPGTKTTTFKTYDIADIWRNHNVKHTIWGYRQLTLLDFGYDSKGSLSSIQTLTNDGSLVSISGYQDLYEDFLQNYDLIEENNNE